MQHNFVKIIDFATSRFKPLKNDWRQHVDKISIISITDRHVSMG